MGVVQNNEGTSVILKVDDYGWSLYINQDLVRKVG